MDIIKKVAEHTNTDASEWEFSEGPELALVLNIGSSMTKET